MLVLHTRTIFYDSLANDGYFEGVCWSCPALSTMNETVYTISDFFASASAKDFLASSKALSTSAILVSVL